MGKIKLKSTGGGSTIISTDDSLTTDEIIQVVGSGFQAPAGVAFDFYGATAPQGALACLGQEVSKTTYPELYSAIGDAWATTGGVVSPAVGNFRLPPQEIGGLGLYQRGVGATNGAVGTYQADVFKSHNHSINTSSLQLGTHYHDVANRANRSNSSASNVTDSGTINSNGDATETRPRSITVLKCVWHGKVVA